MINRLIARSFQFAVLSGFLVFSTMPVAVAATASVAREGFELTVFAEPFDIEYPTSISAGPDGTVYVSVDRDGSVGKEHSGKVIACRDEDGDGRADKFWDYIPDVECPRGGHMVGGKFYLVHPPYLSVFEDRDGDGVAETRTQLVDGLGSSEQDERGGDHTSNGARMGIDGWLYISVGDFGMSSSTGTDGRKVTLHGGGVARVRPDGSRLEVYSYHTRNHCDVAISPYMDLFARDNTNDGKGWNIRVHHLTRLSEHGYPRLYQNFAVEAVKPLLDLGGGSGTGALYLHEPGFPDGMGDCFLAGDWTTGKIYDYSLKPFEATFEAQENVLMTLTRATDIDVDGQSRLYTADWRNGKYNYMGDGVKVGLIHRVVPKGHTPEAWPDLTAMKPSALVEQLGHRSAVRRMETQAEILKRGKSPVLNRNLLKLIRGNGARYGRVAGVFTLTQLDAESAGEVMLPMADRDDLREFVIRALSDQRIQLPEVLLRDALSDPDSRVQLQAVLAIERLGLRSLAGEIVRAAAKPFAEDRKLTGQQDYRFPHTAVQVLGRLQAVAECLAGISDPQTRGVSLAALKLMHRMDAVSGLVKVLDEAGADHVLRMQLIETISRLALREAKWDEDAWWTTRPDDRGPYYDPETWEATPVVRSAIERGFTKLPQELRGPAFEIVAANRLDVGSMDFGGLDPLTVALRSARPNPAELRVLSSAALTRKLKADQRLAAYRAIGRSREPNVLQLQLRVLAGWDDDTSITNLSSRELNGFINSPGMIDRVKKLQALARTESHAVSEVAWKVLLSLSRNPLVPEARRTAVLKIALNNPTDVGYYRALRDLKFTGFEGPIQAAMKSDYRRLRVTARGAMAAILNAAKTRTSGKSIADMPLAEVFKAAMKATGDVGLGKELYARQACASCHAVSLSEIQKGPYLGSVGSKFTKDYLIDSILEPGKIVAQGFRTQTITLNDETEYVGFVTRDEGGELDIRNIGGIVTTLNKTAIRTRKDQTISMMPTGLTANLTLHEFNSLITYLQSLRQQ